MPPQIAALLCFIFIFYLFWIDRKQIAGVSNAVWIPFVWMFLAGSRYVSQWLDLGSALDPLEAYQEGSPVDRVVFFILIAAGIIVLIKRKVKWGHLLRQNKWIVLFFLFGFISILWSDFPFVSFKRWTKALGNVIMALVILSEERPYIAIGVILRRLAFIWLPISLLFIKYYPDMGRSYHMGKPMFTGIAFQKNGLGAICMISSIYFSWTMMLNQENWPNISKPLRLILVFVFLIITAWLLYVANSATSLACLVVALGLFFISTRSFMTTHPERIMIWGMVAVLIIGLLEVTLDVSNLIIRLLGRDENLTTRVPMWQKLLDMAENPFVGVGYESFWLGDRLRVLRESFGKLHQAHNGYLELYLNLGLVGLALQAGCILSGLQKIHSHLKVDYPSAILRLCFILTVVLYNWTEATFYGVSNIWLLLFLGIISIPESYMDTAVNKVVVRKATVT